LIQSFGSADGVLGGTVSIQTATGWLTLYNLHSLIEKVGHPEILCQRCTTTSDATIQADGKVIRGLDLQFRRRLRIADLSLT
jgi:hypothetical protein